MKQNISVEQLNELSEKGFHNLYEYIRNKLARDFAVDSENLAENINIGQMIEFLGDSVHSIVSFHTKDGELDLWSTFLLKNNTPQATKNIHKELVDALWEAVKEVLEK